MTHLYNFRIHLQDSNQYGTHPAATFDPIIKGKFEAHTTGGCLGPGESWQAHWSEGIFHVVVSPTLSLGYGRLRITVNVISVNKGSACDDYPYSIVGRPLNPALYGEPDCTPSLISGGQTQQQWTVGDHVFISNRYSVWWVNDFYFGISANPSDPDDTVALAVTKLEFVRDSGQTVLIWTPADEVPPPLQPYCLMAHVTEDSQVALTWTNAEQTYTGLRVERSASKDGPWTGLEPELEGNATSATDATPPSLDLWYRVVAINAGGETASEPAEADAAIRSRWNTVAHAMGIPDLAEPVAPFTYGEAGEQLFLVCCRLWRLAIAPGLPDPVLSDPADWQTFIETGTFPP